ncbi:MAG: ribosomal protection-like ABC-F family protein [Chitinophagales bacterium]
MSLENLSLVHGHQVYYILPSDRILFNNLQFSISTGNKIGLVGANGTGKSTLLKMIDQQLKPQKGQVSHLKKGYYLPQIDLENYQKETPLFEYLAEHLENWWDVFVLLESRFNTFLAEDLPLKGLSGGELMKVHLVLGVLQQPDLMLLDEPTNHLDLNTLAQLQQFLLEEYKGTYLIVSHNTHFLNQTVETIWELEDGRLQVFDGNYSAYRQQKADLVDARQRQYESARKEVRKVVGNIEREQKRVARSRRTFYEKKLEDRKSKSYFKNKIQKTSTKNKDLNQQQLQKAQQKMDAHKSRSELTVFWKPKTSENHKKRLLFDFKNAALTLPNGENLVSNIELQLYFGERILLSGKNGSGKTSLIRNLQHERKQNPVQLTGNLQFANELKIAFIDQKYDLVNPQKTLLENMETANPLLNFNGIRQQLGRFLFRGDSVDKLASCLSGGELARLTFAMATAAEVDLLVLDEPTNNLDVQTIEIITHALQSYSGSIIVISHDVDFLCQVGIQKAYLIASQTLKQLYVDTSNPEDLYDAILSLSDGDKG